jgi:cell division septation protein DedD
VKPEEKPSGQPLPPEPVPRSEGNPASAFAAETREGTQVVSVRHETVEKEPPSSEEPAVPRGQATPPSEAEKRDTSAPTDPSLEFPRRPYSLYVGSLNTLDQARKALSSLRGKDASLYLARVDLGERGVWWRVYAGHFRDAEEAERYRSERGLNEASPRQTPYAVLIGVFSHDDEVRARAKSLEGLGHSPYPIREEGGRSRLLVGAYVTEGGAEKEAGELRQKGIECRVVRR